MKALRIFALALLSCTLLLVSCKKQKQYSIVVSVNDARMGSATGGGIYDENTTITITATANTGYKFVQWNDGNTDNPRTVKVTANTTYQAIFTEDGNDPEPPQEDGIFVILGAEQWAAAVFQVDNQSMPGNIRYWLYSNEDAEYPQIQGWMDISTTGNVNANLYYMANENDVDQSGYPNWESMELNTTIEVVDPTTRVLTAVQTGKLRNRTTLEEKDIQIVFNNAVWTATPEPSKKWMGR